MVFLFMRVWNSGRIGLFDSTFKEVALCNNDKHKYLLCTLLITNMGDDHKLKIRTSNDDVSARDNKMTQTNMAALNVHGEKLSKICSS